MCIFIYQYISNIHIPIYPPIYIFEIYIHVYILFWASLHHQTVSSKKVYIRTVVITIVSNTWYRPGVELDAQ